LSFLQRIFGRTDRRRAYDPLYRTIVGVARDSGWYREGRVPDTVDGRFDMVAAIVALVLLRLEAEGEAAREPSVLLTELFIEDMDSSLRQIGIGEHVVGKHVGRMMGALGGRLTAFRAARAGELDFAAAARRNVFRDSPPSEAAVTWVADRLEQLSRNLDAQPAAALLAGKVPPP
jgi:cytochrome b pre-mRNA-processing protein 3